MKHAKNNCQKICQVRRDYCVPQISPTIHSKFGQLDVRQHVIKFVLDFIVLKYKLKLKIAFGEHS